MSTTRTIETNLMKKLETFRVMALGEATNSPILLIGPPGVAKTAAVIDFAKARLGGNLSGDDLFLLETDEGTRSNAVKGNIDLEALTTKNEYKIDSPVSKAEVVVINEIDKASASLRNSLLGIMNERVLFNGKERLDCKWNNFIATCNEIPDDEVGSPFWDRFLITHKVNRLTQNDMLKYFAKGGKTYLQKHSIPMPEVADISGVTLSPEKIKKTLDQIYKNLSDRAITFLPTMVKNVMVIWKLSEDKAFIKTTELLVSKEAAKELAKNLVAKEIRELYDIIDTIGQCSSTEDYDQRFDQLEKAFGTAKASGRLTKSDFEDVTNKLAEEEAKLSFLKDDSAEILDQLNNN
jgi:MoxR-like ATPase